MAFADYASDSEASPDDIDLIKTLKKRKEKEKEPSLSGSDLSHASRDSPQVLRDDEPQARTSASEEKRFAVMVQGPSRPWEYQPFVADQTVDEVLAEIDKPGGQVWYRIEYEDGRREDVGFGILPVAPASYPFLRSFFFFFLQIFSLKQYPLGRSFRKYASGLLMAECIASQVALAKVVASGIMI
jgi:hypothetical protein